MPESDIESGVINSDNLRATVVGFLGALCVFAFLLWIIGIDQTVTALTRASVPILVGVVVVASCWLIAWGLSLHTVLGALGATITVPAAVLVFVGATFANNVTPFGQAGGEPVSALFISQASDSEYETGLAAIASVDALNFMPSIALASVGLGYFATTITFGQHLKLAAFAVGGFTLTVPIAGYFGWRRRYQIERLAVRGLTPLFQRIGGRIPRRSPPTRHVLEQRIEGFFTAIERVATNPRQLLLALSFSAAGWVGLAISLWLSLFALGYTVPIAVVLVAIPAGAMASITPLPGGLGGVEVVLITLVGATTVGISTAAVVAAVAIHRGATYWLPTIVGGGTAAVFADR